jgi:uncharacterized OsmC-like protein
MNKLMQKNKSMTSKITYTGNLRTEATHLKSGTTIITDAPTDNNGKGEAFSPTDLVATAAASCMMTIMGIKADGKGLNINGASATVNKIMGSNPRHIAKIEIVITMPKNGYSDSDKKSLMAAGNGCPVHKSLGEDVEIESRFEW